MPLMDIEKYIKLKKNINTPINIPVRDITKVDINEIVAKIK
jgi:hypothetical protein